MSLTKVSYSMIAGASLNVLDYGADPTGVTDSTSAIQAAYAAAQATGQTATGTVTGASTKYRIFYPKGIYKVSGTINTNGSEGSFGDRAIIQATAGTNVFLSTGYQDTFYNLVIVGGAKAISFVTGNIDTCTTLIDRCEFQQQTTSVFDTDSNSNSTLITVTNCKINNTNAGCVVGNFITGDKVVFGPGNWIEVGSTVVFQVGTVGNTSTGCALVLDGVFGVPYTTLGTWIVANETSSVYCVNACRFGGESVSGPTTIVKTYQKASSSVPTSLIISDSGTYSAGATIQFYGIPNVTVFRNNTGCTVPGNGFYFDSSITSANLGLLQEFESVWDVEGNGCPQFKLSGANGIAMDFAYSTTQQRVNAVTITTADKILQIPINTGGYGASNSTVGCTATNSTNTFGAFAFQVTSSATPTTDSFTQAFTTALSGLSTGRYTAVFDVENVTGYPLLVTMGAGLAYNNAVILKGKNVLSFPFYWDTSYSQVVFVQLSNFYLAGQVAKISSFRLFAGNITLNTQNTTMYGTAAPSGSLQAEVADRVIQQVPAVGSPKAWVCTVKGAPGTWVSEGNL
jgi:Pectate lyase superfamily protein